VLKTHGLKKKAHNGREEQKKSSGGEKAKMRSGDKLMGKGTGNQTGKLVATFQTSKGKGYVAQGDYRKE